MNRKWIIKNRVIFTHILQCSSKVLMTVRYCKILFYNFRIDCISLHESDESSSSYDLLFLEPVLSCGKLDHLLWSDLLPKLKRLNPKPTCFPWRVSVYCVLVIFSQSVYFSSLKWKYFSENEYFYCKFNIFCCRWRVKTSSEDLELLKILRVEGTR